jgi:hypothetical protein
MKNECWKPVVGYETLYEISNYGRLRRPNDYVSPTRTTTIGHIISPSRHTDGYLQYKLGTTRTNRKTIKSHILVMAAFVGPRPKGYDINHKDGNKQNNHIDNLEYCTRSRNSQHAYDTGLTPIQPKKIFVEPIYDESIERIWKSVPPYNGIIEVSNCGEIRRWSETKKRGRYNSIIRGAIQKETGYKYHLISYKTKKKNHSTHSLVAESFLGPRPENYEINHKDGNKLNNHVNNLEYIHKVKNKKIARDSNASGCIKLNQEKADQIRKLVIEKIPYGQIVEQFGVSKAQISRIINGKQWI